MQRRAMLISIALLCLAQTHAGSLFAQQSAPGVARLPNVEAESKPFDRVALLQQRYDPPTEYVPFEEVAPFELDTPRVAMQSQHEPGLADPPYHAWADAEESKDDELALDNSFFRDGFRWQTKDGEYQLHFHNETQLDMRAYGTPDSDPVNPFGYYIPRMRMIFNGCMTEPIEYNISINKGLGDLNLLDAYLNFNYDSRCQFRFGRFRVPFTYDWYELSNQFLTTPERSVFALNYGYNRNMAAMLHGEVLDERVEYAVAAAVGPRNSYFDSNVHKDVLAYLNVRPFGDCDNFLQQLNIGGSVAVGIQNQDPLPVDFRTSASASDSSGNLVAMPSFLELNPNVIELGERRMAEIHAAYYYNSLTLMAAVDSGFNGYGFSDAPGQTQVSTSGYHVQFGYFLTGEHIKRREMVTPLRPFDLRCGKRGPGAIEVQARFDHFQVGPEMFTASLANENQWTNEVNTIDAGFNWYLTRYVKIYLDWQHSEYASPVQYRPGGYQTSSDLYWVRTQLYF